jgi:3-hydroxyisobutyrate dehydrogenase-like beta-hydroxyacid dehydrogenase
MAWVQQDWLAGWSSFTDPKVPTRQDHVHSHRFTFCVPQTGFAVDLALKDVGHMRQLAADTSCPLPLADLAFNHLLAARAKHGGKLDWGAVHLAVRDAAGLPPNFDDQHK